MKDDPLRSATPPSSRAGNPLGLIGALLLIGGGAYFIYWQQKRKDAEAEQRAQERTVSDRATESGPREGLEQPGVPVGFKVAPEEVRKPRSEFETKFLELADPEHRLYPDEEQLVLNKFDPTVGEFRTVPPSEIGERGRQLVQNILKKRRIRQERDAQNAENMRRSLEPGGVQPVDLVPSGNEPPPTGPPPVADPAAK